MKLTIEITMENTAFEDDPGEVSRILDQVKAWAEDRRVPNTRRLHDVNGNDVGCARITD